MEEPEFVPEIAVEEETRTGSGWAYRLGIILVLVMVGIWLNSQENYQIPKLPPVPIMAEKFWYVPAGWFRVGFTEKRMKARLLPVEKAFLSWKNPCAVKATGHPAQTPAGENPASHYRPSAGRGSGGRIAFGIPPVRLWAV